MLEETSEMSIQVLSKLLFKGNIKIIEKINSIDNQ